MLNQARRRLAHHTAAVADLRLGVAGALPFADRSADHVAAVNTAAMWPDLPAALANALRVLHRGGSLLLAWHSTTAPAGFRRRLAQPETWWVTVLGRVPRPVRQRPPA